LPNKRTAEHFAKLKYYDLNYEVFRSQLDVPWDDLIYDYGRHYDVRQLTPSAKYEGLLTLRHVVAFLGELSSKNITQRAIDAWIIHRADSVAGMTLNKDISNLRAFIAWGQKKHYLARELEVHKIKVTEREVVSLTTAQVRNLLISARTKNESWYIRVLLAVTTGLRKNDIESLEIGDLDFENHSVHTHSKKTRKSMAQRPLPSAVIPVLTKYVGELPAGQVRLLSDSNTHKKWKAIRSRAGLPDLRFHDLRSVFSSALQARGVSLSVVQTLLEHSSPSLTARTYTQTDPMLTPAVERLPVNEWIE